MTDALLTPHDVGKHLGIHPKTVLNLARRNRIEHYRVGRHVRFTPEQVQAYLRGCQQRAR